MQKTVIMVWLKTDSGTHSNGSIKTYGLGDLLRGTIYLHQMSVHFGFKFVVDLRLHPISQHLIVNEHDHMEYVNANVNKMQIVNCHEPYKFDIVYNASLRNDDPLLICTNMFCNDLLSDECKLFMKTLLTPNEPFSTYINQKNALYNVSSPHSIIHIRLGDDEFFENKTANVHNIAAATKLIKEHAVPTDILMSNSFRFKEYVRSLNVNVTMFNTRPVHLGELSTIFRKNIADSFKETLYEFFTLGNASEIKTYSVYEWVSGFVKFASIIYDIPLIDLKQMQMQQLLQKHQQIQIQTRRIQMQQIQLTRRPIKMQQQIQLQQQQIQLQQQQQNQMQKPIILNSILTKPTVHFHFIPK